MKFALTGNPNSGKTTLFNALTGENQKVGNWAGVTIEKKEGFLKSKYTRKGNSISIVDLPGAYSLSAYTSEEKITENFIKNEGLDVIINIVDGTSMNRGLFLTTQLLELGIPVVVALNKADLLKKKGIEIDITRLSNDLGCPVVETVSSNTGDIGVKLLIDTAEKLVGKHQVNHFAKRFATTADYSATSYSEKSSNDQDQKRYAFVNDLVANSQKASSKDTSMTLQDQADRVLAHKWLGIPIFAIIMWGVFSISQTYLGPFLADTFVGWIDQIYVFVQELMGDNVSPVLSALLLDGVIGGVGAVVGFLPLIMVLFFLLALLEDIGYMARVAVVMDRFLKKVGLSGRSIIPMVIGTGCAIPGIMSTRTIKNERQRRTTAMLTPFMPCGAKLPVIALFAGVFFSDAAWVGTSMYFMGIGIIIIGALIVATITGERNKRSFFIMELPEYKLPSLKRALSSTFSRAKAFIVKAGTVILLCNALVQMMQTFNWRFEVIEAGAESTSILATLATPFAIVLIPLGFGVWQLAAAAITGFIAKENVVGTLAVVYSITNFIDTEELALVAGSSDVASVMGLTTSAALAYLVFNLFTPPCFAAIGAMNAEMEDRRWLFAGIAFQLGTGYTVAFLVYQIGTFILEGRLGDGFVAGGLVVSILLGSVIYLAHKGNVKAKLKVKAKLG